MLLLFSTNTSQFGKITFPLRLGEMIFRRELHSARYLGSSHGLSTRIADDDKVKRILTAATAAGFHLLPLLSPSPSGSLQRNTTKRTLESSTGPSVSFWSSSFESINESSLTQSSFSSSLDDVAPKFLSIIFVGVITRQKKTRKKYLLLSNLFFIRYLHVMPRRQLRFVSNHSNHIWCLSDQQLCHCRYWMNATLLFES